MTESLSAKHLILSVLQILGDDVELRTLLAIADVVNVSANSVRVSLTRLAKGGQVERGPGSQVRRASRVDPVARWVDAWRLGEARLHPWDGRWQAFHLPRTADRTVRRRSHRALGRLGLVEGRDGLWVRPHCIVLDTHATATALGLEAEAEPMLLEPSAALAERWRTSGWDLQALRATWRTHRRGLLDSMEAIPSMLAAEALAHSFSTGRRAIEILAFDPLLPPEIVDTSSRADLTTTLLDYDTRARASWLQALEPFMESP